MPYRILYIVVAAIAPIIALDLVWTIADTLNGFMALPNLVALLGLSGIVINLTKKHFICNKTEV